MQMFGGGGGREVLDGGRQTMIGGAEFWTDGKKQTAEKRGKVGVRGRR